jgi:alpha-beta hydrolase superfamily lysophospholipase
VKHQLSALLRITKIMLASACFLLISACLISIDTVNHYVDEATITEPSTLVRHTVVSDGHPMALWEKPMAESKGIILFVHGRTWSGLPDFDLQVEGEQLSLMDGMVDQGYGTYAVDLRGYGGTPRDASQWLSPKKAANDVINVVRWISQRHEEMPVHIFGWSYGSVISLLASQIDDSHVASLTLFGFWLDLDAVTIEQSDSPTLERRVNTARAAASDFIVPGSISQSAIDGFVTQALAADPVRVDWRYQNDFLSIDPTQINTPILLLQGEFDPLTPTAFQSRLFTRLKTADKRWVVISGGDHAAFLETPRRQFIRVFSDFIDQFNP